MAYCHLEVNWVPIKGSCCHFSFLSGFNWDQFLSKELSPLGDQFVLPSINPIALRNTKIVYNFGLSECNRVKGGDCRIDFFLFFFFFFFFNN